MDLQHRLETRLAAELLELRLRSASATTPELAHRFGVCVGLHYSLVDLLDGQGEHRHAVLIADLLGRRMDRAGLAAWRAYVWPGD